MRSASSLQFFAHDFAVRLDDGLIDWVVVAGARRIFCQLLKRAVAAVGGPETFLHAQVVGFDGAVELLVEDEDAGFAVGVQFELAFISLSRRSLRLRILRQICR